MPFHPKLVIFDLDGTLIEYPHEYIFDEALRILGELGCASVPRESIAHHHAHNQMFGFADSIEQRELFEQEFLLRHRPENAPPPKLIPGALETLETLASHDIKLAIATARHQLPDVIRTELAGTGLLRWITLITSGSPEKNETWRNKRPQIRAVCTESGIAATDSFMVGDNPSDIASATAERIGAAIAVRTGQIKEHLLEAENPHHILDHIGHLGSIVPFRAR
jgi:phosphoglycolate phosphatase-like HAD superfamily hydrolase